MLTIFAIPKPFEGSARTIQDNAIGSWIRVGSGCEIILIGDDSGVADAAARHKVRHEAVIAHNEFGTPIIADVFTRMDRMASHRILALVNADIILLDDFLPAVKVLADVRNKFLAVSSRFNCWIGEPLTFDLGWDAALRKRARAENRMYPAGGSDIFVYCRGLFDMVPPFAIGRGYWDNWLMKEAGRIGANLIDLTEAVTAVHQDHTYDTVASLAHGEIVDKHIFATEEGRRNLSLADGHGSLYTVADATHIMAADRRLYSSWRPGFVGRRVKAWLRRKARSQFAYPV